MVYKALTYGNGFDLFNRADGWGMGADTVVVMDNSKYEWPDSSNGNVDTSIRTYEGDDYIDASRSAALNTHCVKPGEGNDYYIGNNAGDAVQDGAGNDITFLGGSLDIYYSGSGNDYADGGAGEDLVYFNRLEISSHSAAVEQHQGVTFDLANQGPQNLGVFGTDTLVNFESIVGSLGSDTFYGDNGNNTMWAYDGDDILYGRGGDDILYGYKGADVLIGGIGRDILNVDEDGYQHFSWGQTYDHWRDTIRYTSVRESGTTDATRDRIYWFDSGTSATSDRIDLSRIDANHFKAGNQSFEFHTSNGRFASSAGEIRLSEVYTATTKYTIVHIDTDSDSADEMQIIVQDVVGMTRADFIL
jgi:Ca2+-binding RTX toxin-like protein